MSSPQQWSDKHADRAQRHQGLARANITNAPDWAVIMFFYAALHQLLRYAARTSSYGQVKTHEDMTRYIHSRPELRRVAPAYTALKNLSQIARYRCPGPSHDVMQPSKVGTQVQGKLSDVIACVNHEIAKLPDEPAPRG